VWQGKELREAIFGCVATKGVRGEILGLWQTKELGEKEIGKEKMEKSVAGSGEYGWRDGMTRGRVA